MSRQFFNEAILWVTASGVAVANSTTETILTPNVTVPANYLQGERNLEIVAMGVYSTTSAPTMTFSLRWGGVAGTVLTKSGALVGASSITSGLWNLYILMQTRSNGSTGTVMANGWAMLHTATAGTAGSATGAPAVGPMTVAGQTVPAVATVDLTADTALALTITWGTASASNTIQLLNYSIRSLN